MGATYSVFPNPQKPFGSKEHAGKTTCWKATPQGKEFGLVLFTARAQSIEQSLAHSSYSPAR